MNYPKITIIILNYNGIEDTTNCLSYLLKTKYPHFKIIVVDNGSLHNEAALLSKKFKSKKIQFIRNEKNYGFSQGNNKVLQDVHTKYVVLLNNDTQTPPNWLNPLVEIMEKNTKVAAVQPKILWLTDTRYFDYAGAAGGFIDFLGYPFTRGRIFKTIEKDKGQYNTVLDIFWSSGAAMMIRRKVLDEVGFFDKTFFNYMEEIDLCYRFLKAGYRVICQPKSYVYHKVASTASKNPIKKRYWEHRNNLLFVLKNFPLKDLIFIFPIRIVMEYASIIYYLFINSPKYIVSILLSQLSLLFYGPKVIISRIIAPPFNNKEMKTIYRRSIVFSYFLLKQKYFSQLNKSFGK